MKKAGGHFTIAFKNAHTFLRQKETGSIQNLLSLLERYICPIRPERYFEQRHRFQFSIKFG